MGDVWKLQLWVNHGLRMVMIRRFMNVNYVNIPEGICCCPCAESQVPSGCSCDKGYTGAITATTRPLAAVTRAPDGTQKRYIVLSCIIYVYTYAHIYIYIYL